MDSDNKVCIWVSDGMIEEISDSFTELTGYKTAEILDHPASEVFGKILKASADFSDPGSIIEKEAFIFTDKLEAREVIINSSESANKSKRIYTFTEKSKSRVDEKFPYICNVIDFNLESLAIYACVPEIILLNASLKYLDIIVGMNGEKSDYLGTSIEDILKGYSDNGREPIWNDVFASGKPCEYHKIISQRPDEEAVAINGHFVPLYQDGKIKYIIHHINVSEMQDEGVQKQKEDLETILENMTEALFIADSKGKFVKMNAQMRKQQYLDKKPAKLGDNFGTVTYHDMSGNTLKTDDLPVSQALRGKTVRDYRMLIRNPYKDIIVELNACPIYDREGNITMAVVCSRDITQPMENEKVKDEFLSIVSHEFKTPITVILSIIQAMDLICKNEMSNKLKMYIKQIKQNSLRQLRLVNNLLDVTRANAGRIVLNKKKHNLVLHTRLIVDSVQEFARQKGINLIFKAQKKEIIIGIDDEKYERILLNLLSNAIKFTPKDKCVIVELTEENKFINLRVIDEGIGIPESRKDRIFERFGQVDSSLSRQAEGSGIGLYLSKMLLQLMNGEISLSSTEGKGSTFTVLLPRLEAEDIYDSETTHHTHDDRLINSISIEFSDIYM